MRAKRESKQVDKQACKQANKRIVEHNKRIRALAHIAHPLTKI